MIVSSVHYELIFTFIQNNDLKSVFCGRHANEERCQEVKTRKQKRLNRTKKRNNRMKKEKRLIIATGGTIDSYYDGTKDTAVPRESSILPQFFKVLKLYDEVVFVEICMKDSRSLTNEDRKKIVKTIESAKEKKIIITHGTYTMPDTARYIKVNCKRKDVTIILTGSMIPLEGFTPSDAGFNLGFAMGKLDELGQGIYVAMNGKIFSPEECVKLLDQGKFGSIFGEKR